MYIDKDDKGNISIMEINNDEAKDFASLLFEFELRVEHFSAIPLRERGRLSLLSAKMRFQLIDILK
jgi:hypothetical protein